VPAASSSGPAAGARRTLLHHSPARGGVMALIICLGARPGGKRARRRTLPSRPGRCPRGPYRPPAVCSPAGGGAPGRGRWRPSRCRPASRSRRRHGLLPMDTQARRKPGRCVVSLGSSSVSSMAFSPLSQDFCGMSREEVGIPKKTTLLTGCTWCGILSHASLIKAL
jgi:hypothetical protein